MSIEVSRVYDDQVAGTRVLVDRLWPRGLRKGDARVGRWMKDVAPSTELRRWYGHDPAKFTEFVRRYQAELDEPAASDALRELRGIAAERDVALVTATKEIKHSHAAVLASILEEADDAG